MPADPNDPDELGASDEVITYKDEGENGEDSAAEIQASDLADIKNSLVNESAYPEGANEIENQRSGLEPKDNISKPDPFGSYSLPALLPYASLHGQLSAAHKLYPFPSIPGLPLPTSLDHKGLPVSRSEATDRIFAGQPPQHYGISPWGGQNGSAASSMFAAATGGVFRPPTYQQLLTNLDQSRFPAGGPPGAAAGGGGPPPPPGMAPPGMPPNGASGPGGPHHQPPKLMHPSDLINQNAAQEREKEKKNKPYVKKPLNAFMLFMKENREKVMQESTLKESAAINQILGRKWHQLERSEQNKYYEMAKSERVAHQRLHPNWTARDNYATSKHRKRRKRTAAAAAGNGGPDFAGSGSGNESMSSNARGQGDSESGDNSESASKKCRARFGLEKQESWCKHCRRKKKCSVYTKDQEDGANSDVESDGECSDGEECRAAAEADSNINNNNNSEPPRVAPLTSSSGVISHDVLSMTHRAPPPPPPATLASDSLLGKAVDLTSSNSPLAGGSLPGTSASMSFPSSVTAPSVFAQSGGNPLAGITPFSAASYTSAASSLYPGSISPFSPLQSIASSQLTAGTPLFPHPASLPFSSLFPSSLSFKVEDAKELMSMAAAAVSQS